METSRLQKFAWMFFALMLTTGLSFGQGWRNANRTTNNENFRCVNQISNLTEKQKTAIDELVEKHRETMADFRTEMRSTADLIEKNEIRGEMLKTVKAHREAIKKQLTEEQQEELEKLFPGYDNLARYSYEGDFRRGMSQPRFKAGNCGYGRGRGAAFRQGRQMNQKGNFGRRGGQGRRGFNPNCIYNNIQN